MAGGCSGVPASQLGIAFACVIGAGFASVIGALAIVFFQAKDTRHLAASLAFAAGVMLYISLVDIYAGKAIGHFVEAGYDDPHAFTYATICFFCGFPVSWVLDKVADRMSGGGHGCPACPVAAATSEKANPDDATAAIDIGLSQSQGRSTDEERGRESDVHQSGQRQGEADLEREQKAIAELRSKNLMHIGIMAALAIALHNLPEGLVTFVGFMDSVNSGITTAVAIAVHNVPEGMVVASAVYFGTGLRGRAILWASLAAVTEPLGGLIGLAVVCGGSMSPTVFGILFGLVGGIMTYISLKELLPGARNFDPEDRVTTVFLVAGMIVMACSLIAISFSAPTAVEAVAAAALPPSLPPSLPPLAPSLAL